MLQAAIANSATGSQHGKLPYLSPIAQALSDFFSSIAFVQHVFLLNDNTNLNFYFL